MGVVSIVFFTVSKHFFGYYKVNIAKTFYIHCKAIFQCVVHTDTFIVNAVKTAARCNLDTEMFTFQLDFVLTEKSRHILICLSPK